MLWEAQIISTLLELSDSSNSYESRSKQNYLSEGDDSNITKLWTIF